MGCIQSNESDERTRKLDIELKQKRLLEKTVVSLLMLGAGESGKSTFVRQVYNLHGKGYSEVELKHFHDILKSNILQCTIVIIEGMKTLNINFENKKNEKISKKILTDYFECEANTLNEALENVKSIWADSAIEKIMKNRSKLHLMDSCEYLIKNIDKFADDNYSPTNDDIVNIRLKTTGIQETNLVVNELQIRIIDVGGQRAERKKWIHCFSDVTSVFFMTALSEYDLLLEEDNTTNRMRESITIFDSICNNTFFSKKPVIIFFNKDDIFRNKVNKQSFVEKFPEYDGPDSPNEIANFIIFLFKSQNTNAEKRIYTHRTTATDSTNINFVFSVVLDTIVNKNLLDVGLG